MSPTHGCRWGFSPVRRTGVSLMFSIRPVQKKKSGYAVAFYLYARDYLKAKI